MLRMTRSSSGDTAVLLLEGKLTEPWTAELRAEIEARGPVTRLDLAGLSFIDAGGAELLHELERSGVALVGASVFVRELLDLINYPQIP
jgi:ABC-type transporter Mla MlaB component